MTLSCNANNLQPLVMALSGRPELKGFYAKDVAERRRLGDVLCDQLSRDLLRLLNDEIHTDLTLNVGQTKFKVHKAVIMARAPKFYMFVTRQETEDTFTVQNVEPSEIKAFLKIVYASLWSVKDTEDHILHMINNQSVSSPDHSEDKCSNLQSTTLSAIESTGNNSNNESRTLNAHPKETYNCDDPRDCEPPSELGNDLLSLFKCSCCTDVTIQIEDKCFHVHRAILCARSSYFAAMLSGCWAETSRELIKIQGVKQADMKVIMHFIYGGIMDLPKSTDPGQVLSIADMYGLEGLREVAVYVLKRDYCKFFHKPTVGMQQSVLECLSIAYSVGEEPLYTSCMRWIEKYFVKCWSERSFANLPVDLQKNCFTLLVQSLSYRNAAFLLMESDRLISSLPGVKWADRARSLASELQEECVRFIVTNFSQIIRSESFAHLLQAQGMSSRPYLLEHVFNEIEKSVSFQNCSFLFMALDELLNLASENKMVFTCKIQALRDKLWSFLVQSFYAVRHTEGWKLMRPSDQSKIQAVAFDKGDDRRLAKKPIFTSSQQNRSKSVISGQTLPTDTKRHSDTDLLNRRKMKSDSLGASGHTANVSRNSSGKGKDDVKGKDVKKVATKGSKEPKPTERMTTAKPKIIVKAKPENNDNTKTESCASKCDTSSTPNPAPSEKMGTRPKASNGTSNPPAKVKLLKKAGKDPSSPVRGSLPSMKFANCNGELSNSSLSSGEQGHDQAAAEQPNSTTSSPQVNKTLKNSLDSSKDLGMGAKSKSSAKMSNGSSVKRKVNEAECREVSSSSSTKKVTVDGGNDSVLQKKKGNKISTCTDLRPKSAPAALSKKQGIPGDSSKMPKSVSSKQTEVKSDSKLVNQPTSADKHGSLNKNTTKTTFTSASKTQSNVQSNKNSVIKSSITNHKESKAKLPSTSKTSNLQNRTNQKSSPSAVKNGNNKPSMCLGKNLPKSDGSESPVSVANEGKQAASCQFEEGAEHSEDMAITADVSCQDNSMGNQESMVQKPDLEQCPCQENNLAASVLHYPSNSKEGLTEDTNQTKVRNVDSAGSDEVPFVSLSSEQKPDCKNICDSENSKCADSSSESELCSVKEVERVPKQKEREDMTFMEFSENTTKNMQSSSNAAESCLQSVSTSHQHAMQNGGHLMNCASESQIFDYQRDMNITEVADSHQKFDIKLMGPWNKHSSMLHERESPESESGSASTSSDDIKPRSEDYDAGGSQDDDGSNERGISKCSTMRCHDFLGRSSSDTSTPEELKGYDGSLRIDVKLKKDSSELFRVNSTSDDEGPRKRTEPWLQRDLSRQSANHTNVCGNVQFSQEIEHLSSSADETEDERSEAENPGLKGPSDVDVQPYQGIINLAFDDNAEIESDGQRTTGNKSFMRSVLLSVDECEELGSDEGDLHASQVRKAESLTPTDVFEKNNTDGSSAICSECSQIEEGKPMENTSKYPSSAAKQLTLDESSMTGQVVAESDACKATYKPTEPESELKSQARPCHLDLYTELPSDTQRYCCTKTAKACKSQFLDYQGRDNHTSPTESSNNALSAGHIDDIDSLAQTCMYDQRPPKSLSPIYEMDPVEGIEQRLKTESRLMEFDFEDQQFVERDWTLLRELLADHGSDVDIINSVPEDLSLAQYLINQTLLLARENPKSQGKAWGDLSSPFEDSTSVTVTSFSPDECSSPHGEWTILELETHH